MNGKTFATKKEAEEELDKVGNYKDTTATIKLNQITDLESLKKLINTNNITRMI